MKQLLLIFLILIFSNSISQTQDNDFDISYEIERLSDEKCSVRISIKNISSETLYISNNKNFHDVKSEKTATYDLGYSLVTDPLLSPKMHFYFIKLETGKTYNDFRIVSAKTPERLIVNFEYLSESKKLFGTNKPKLEYALKCEDYVHFAYNEGKIKHKSKKFDL